MYFQTVMLLAWQDKSAEDAHCCKKSSRTTLNSSVITPKKIPQVCSATWRFIAAGAHHIIASCVV